MQRIKKCLPFIYIGLLLAIFGGFTWMHYSTVKSAPSVWGNLPETIIGATVSGDNSTAISPSPNTSNRTISEMDIFQAMLSDNERATTRVFALVTVLIAAATLIVALQFFVNHQMLTELEEKRKKFDDEFKKKESKLYRIENAVKKVESLAQATSYPLRISMTNIDNEEFCKHQDIGRFIQYSFNGFDKDNRKDSADWNIILFLAQQALASMESENDEFKTKFRRLLAVAACMSEGRTSDREEKYILLKLAIETFNSMETKELCDKVNLASAYARRGMLVCEPAEECGLRTGRSPIWRYYKGRAL